MTYNIHLLHINITCKHYQELYSEMRSIVKEYLLKELNGVEIGDDIFEVNHRLRYNSFTNNISFVLFEKLEIDEKTHHKLMLLNSDYQYRDILSSWRIARNGDGSNISVAVEENTY